MKILLTMFLIIGFAIPCFATTATETTNKDNSVTVSITFTRDEYNIFTLDKGDAKEWVRNACDVNVADYTQRIKADLTRDIAPSDADFKAKVQALQVEKASQAKLENK